jgi:hypothetical protein
MTATSSVPEADPKSSLHRVRRQIQPLRVPVGGSGVISSRSGTRPQRRSIRYNYLEKNELRFIEPVTARVDVIGFKKTSRLNFSVHGRRFSAGMSP